MEIREIGEFGLIEKIKGCVTTQKESVVLGIGDDAAVIKETSGNYWLITSDTLVEGVHFRQEFATLWQIGWKAGAANLSDIAAMGGEPRWAVVCLSFPGHMRVRDVEDLYRGMDRVCSKFGCDIVGGDTTLSMGGMTISIAVVGRVDEERLATRRGAKVGDAICVTGDLGGSKAGLESLKEKGQTYGYAIRRHLEPVPRIHEAKAIGDVARVHAMIDISDGLSSEVNHICRESRTGARIFAASIPVHEDTREIARRRGESVLDYALSGGEDFELLFTLAPEKVDAVRSHVEKNTGTPISVIGEITDDEKMIVIVDEDGNEEKLFPLGYQHF